VFDSKNRHDAKAWKNTLQLGIKRRYEKAEALVSKRFIFIGLPRVSATAGLSATFLENPVVARLIDCRFYKKQGKFFCKVPS